MNKIAQITSAKLAIGLFLFLGFSKCLFGATWYIDKSASGANDGTSWVNAWSTLSAMTGVQAGDTVYISGGPAGSSQTYPVNIAAPYPGQWLNVVNGATYKIGQDTAHNGTVIFDGLGGAYFLVQGWQNVVISGDANDGLRHFKVINIVQGGVGDNWVNVKISYIDFGQVEDGIKINPGTNIEIDHNNFYIIGDNANRCTYGLFNGTSYDTSSFHDNVITMPRRANNDGFGPDAIQWNGSGFSLYNNVITTYPLATFSGGQHQDGWQALGPCSYIKVYGNFFLNVTNYAVYPEPTGGGFSHMQIYNNIAVITFPNNTQAFAISASTDSGRQANDVLVANNLAVGYNFPYTFRNPNLTSDPTAWVNCFFYNNVSVNGGNNIIDPNIVAANNISLDNLQAAADFVLYAANSETNDYHLKVLASALLVDQGTNLSANFTTDKDGVARPNGVAWDIGPYELVQTTPAVGTQPASVVTTPGGTATFTVGGRGQAPLNYQWRIGSTNLTNGGNVAGANSATLTLTNVSLADAGSYSVVVNNTLGPAATSTGATLTVGAGTPPTITTQPSGSSVTEGATVTFTGAATGTPAPTLHWSKDGILLSDGGKVSGATTTTLTLTNVLIADSGAYALVADNNFPPAATSNSATLTVTAAVVVPPVPTTAAPAITTQPLARNLYAGSTVSFTVAASGNPNPSFQWRKDGTNLTNGGNVSGATSATLTLTNVAVASSGNYSAVASNGIGSDATSNNAALTVTVLAVGSQTVTAGHGVTLSGGNVSGSLQWQVATAGSSTWTNLGNGNSYSGVTTNTLQIDPASEAQNNYQYRLVSNGTDLVSSFVLTVGPGLVRYPVGIAADAFGNLYVTDTATDTIQKINGTAQVSAFAGASGQVGSADGAGADARFNDPTGVIVAPGGAIGVSDAGNATIRLIASNGEVASLAVTTLAGSTSTRGNTDGSGTAATFSSPTGIGADHSGNFYVADSNNHTIRKVAVVGGAVTTLAGTAGSPGSADGIGPAARFNHPTGIAVDAADNVYVADSGNNLIRKITPNGTVTTLAGLFGVSGSTDGTGAGALFNNPTGMAIDILGYLYVADTGNSTIRRVSPAGVVVTLAGVPGIAGLKNGTTSEAWFNGPLDVTIGTDGSLYVADTGNALIRRIANGNVTWLVLTSAISTPSTPTTPTLPTVPTPPTPPASSSGGGGGGAPSTWFVGALGILCLLRRFCSSKAKV